MNLFPTQTDTSADVIVQGHGSIVLFWPRTSIAKDWFTENVDVQQTWGEGIVVEPRYVSSIIEGLENAGLEVV